MSDSRTPLRGEAASAALMRWLARWGVRLMSWVGLLAGFGLWGYGRRLSDPNIKLLGFAMTVAGALGLAWAYHTKPQKTWTMPTPSDPNLPIDCPSCGMALKHLSTTRDASGEIHIYRCPTHDQFRLDSEGLKPLSDPW